MPELKDKSLAERIEAVGGTITRCKMKHRIAHTTRDSDGNVVATSLSGAWAWVKRMEGK